MKTSAIATSAAFVAALFVAACAQSDTEGMGEAEGADADAMASMTFFITSAGSGDGANLGGLEGADAHCETLAAAQGAGGMGWMAYLSTIAEDGSAAVNARDRIGAGPWHNQAGVMVANDVDDLHSEAANLTKETILTEKGEPGERPGRRPEHARHPHGVEDGRHGVHRGGLRQLRQLDQQRRRERPGRPPRPASAAASNPTSWNSAHSSRGCSQQNLQGTGGNGLFYCFAARSMRGGP